MQAKCEHTPNMSASIVTVQTIKIYSNSLHLDLAHTGFCWKSIFGHLPFGHAAASALYISPFYTMTLQCDVTTHFFSLSSIFRSQNVRIKLRASTQSKHFKLECKYWDTQQRNWAHFRNIVSRCFVYSESFLIFQQRKQPLTFELMQAKTFNHFAVVVFIQSIRSILLDGKSWF